MSTALRLGLMVPPNDTTMERELLAWLPAGSTCATLRESQARDIALATAYPDLVNGHLKAYLADAGIRVKRRDSLRAATMDDGCDALFIACSQLPTYEILDGLRTRFGRPVRSSVRATAWRALRIARLQAA
jgi:maleate cis-trans isomerase